MLTPDDEQSLLLLVTLVLSALREFRPRPRGRQNYAVASHPRTFEGYRELGNIYQQLKDDNENAVSAFEGPSKNQSQTIPVFLLKLVRLLKSMDRKGRI
jgi:hypothetical protein